MHFPDRTARLFATVLSLCMGAAMAADREDWLVLERTGTARPETISVMRELPAAPTRGKLPVLLGVAWRYQALPNGMPAAEAAARDEPDWDTRRDLLNAIK